MNSEGQAEMLPLIQRFVTTQESVTPQGKPLSPRYLKLLGGNFLRTLSEVELAVFARSFARDAQDIKDDELGVLLHLGWRPRLVAAYLIGLDRRTLFRPKLRELLLESAGPYAGKGYCFAFARFGEASDAESLVLYLDRYLPRPECRYDQSWAMGALLHLDERLGTDHAAHFLVPGGLWEQSWLKELNVDPTEPKRWIDRLLQFADDCMSGGDGTIAHVGR
ncbi:DUF6000 family protein [Streptosporangium sp. NPDC005286]|uniref:DUF6000 family protein n=1 Tax=Streptosporangium sp. NPDC005286 TaxID=3154463 RepID=UPI0033B77630